MAIKKKVGGRPTKYRERFCEELVTHMKKGFSFESFAARADVHFDTLYEWCKVHPKFSDAKKLGDVYSRLFWEAIAIQAVTGGLKNFNNTVWVFTMKNRFGWRDRQPDEIAAANRFEPIIIETEKKTLTIENKNK